MLLLWAWVAALVAWGVLELWVHFERRANRILWLECSVKESYASKGSEVLSFQAEVTAITDQGRWSHFSTGTPWLWLDLCEWQNATLAFPRFVALEVNRHGS